MIFFHYKYFLVENICNEKYIYIFASLMRKVKKKWNQFVL